MNEDYDLTLRLSASYKASYVPDALVLMREHNGRISRSRPEMPLLDYIGIVERFVAEHPDLPPQVRARGRKGLANVHFKLSRLYMERGDKAAARRHSGAMVRLRPFDRRALPAYVRSWSLRSAECGMRNVE